MFQAREKIDRIRIASPCPKNWEAMIGDNRTRFCDLCSLHVYNISDMTRKEVETLIATTEGRICARLYKRADGTVITKDCPVGLRAIRRRVSRVAGAVITTIFSFCLSVMGQKPIQDEKTCPAKKVVTVQRTQDNRSLIQGSILDPNGAGVFDATVTLINDKTRTEQKTVTNDEGYFRFSVVEVGKYDLKVHASGYERFKVLEINVESSQASTLSIEMTPEGSTVLVGGVGSEPLIESNGGGLNRTISPKQITTLPY